MTKLTVTPQGLLGARTSLPGPRSALPPTSPTAPQAFVHISVPASALWGLSSGILYCPRKPSPASHSFPVPALSPSTLAWC